ncbi:MAG TPA: SDR family oxidoreductase, partial [Candidatus Polarisedimenticolia bacterium]|nr:SDR family oxidoreductase [Candidatus Polarisedimenticolia bacterium]
GEVVYEVGDVSDEAALGRLFAATDSAFGRLDILINNAGISGDVRALVRIPSRNYRYAFNVHLHTMKTTRLAARLMRRHGIEGTILNVGTYFTSPHRQILRPYPFRTPYTGAQAWKLEHTRASAWELAKAGIRVIALNLGPVEGGRIDSIVYPLGALERGLWGREVKGEEIRRKTEEMHPARRFLKQEDAARSIVALVSRELRDSANGTVVELAGGVDYKVPPQVAPPLLGGKAPDLSGRQVLLIGRPGSEQASTLILAFTACGARVVLACPDAGRVLLDLARGRAPESYTDGQKRLLGGVRAVDLDPADEGRVAALFEDLTTPAPPGGTGTEAGARLDAIVALTGDGGMPGEFTDMTSEEEEGLKERFAFEPAGLMRHGLAALLVLGNRRAGIRDGRFLALRPFLELLERGRGTPSPAGGLQRTTEGWTSEEEALLQAGARRATGSLIVVAPAVTREESEEATTIGVVRAGLQAVVSSVAAELATARAALRANAIFPGTEAGEADAARAARLALQLVGDANASISGMIYYPDERNAGLQEIGTMAGKTAVVTGGGRNLGQSIALRLSREGARLVLTGRGEADLDLTARAIRALGGEAHGVAADIAFPGDREKVLEAVRGLGGNGSGGGGVDLWVNNAGIGGAFATLGEIELDGEARWHQTLAVNFTGAWLGMVRAVLDMRRRGASGGVVNVSTFYADQPYVFRIPYTVPKILLKTCAQILADALRPHGIYIADIQPSLIDGPRFQWVAKNYGEHFRRQGVEDPAADPEIQEWFRRLIPKTAPRPEDVAEAVAFAARRGLTGSGQGIPVSTLPVAAAATPSEGAGFGRPGKTVVIIASGRTFSEIDRAGAFAAWSLEGGAERVIVAADDGMMARLGPRLRRGPTRSPWWNLPIAPEREGRLEIRGVDPASASSIADLFSGLEPVDTVVHVPGACEAAERFVMFPADPALTGLDEATLKTRYLEHQRALSLFLDRHVTAGLIVARQAARSLAPGGSLVVSQRPPRTPEAILACEALRQIIRTAAEEMRLFGKTVKAAYTQRTPTPGARLRAFALDGEARDREEGPRRPAARGRRTPPLEAPAQA